MPYEINNLAAFGYLKAFERISLPSRTDYKGKDKQHYARLIRHIDKIKNKLSLDNGEFDDKQNYTTLYTSLHELAQKIEVKENPDAFLNGALLEFHKKCFVALYENNSKLFENINEHLIQDPQNQQKSRESHIHERLTHYKIKKPTFFQFTHPENWANKLFSGLFGIDYNPLKRTNIPYIAFERDNAPTLLRMGTQVQGMQTLQPAFQNYLAVKKSIHPNKKIHHVYINLLKRNMKNQSGKFERYFERSKSKALEKINGKSLGATVITLPADNAAFFEGYDKKKGQAKNEFQRFQVDDIERQLIDSITHNKNDFNIPPEIKDILFENGLEKEISALFQESAKFVLGESKQVLVSAQQRQAIMFDFVKFGLTNYIANKLNPDTMNISCKDAIDRGGVHSLWYEFRRRMPDTMSEAEFNMHLDASALLVKGRPVNDHRVLIWNVLNQSFLKNPQIYEKSPWVKQWLVNNYPTDKKIIQLQSKSNLSQDDKTILDKHLSTVAQYIEQLSQVKSVSLLPIIAPSISTEIKIKRSVNIGHLHSVQKDDLSQHLSPRPCPIALQSQAQLETMHEFLTKPKIQSQLGISKVKQRKLQEDGTHGISFEMAVKEKPVKVIAKAKKDTDALMYATKKPIPLENLEAFANEFTKVILPNAAPGCTLDFSVATIEQRPVLERVFKEAIAKAILEGKFSPETAPKILSEKPTMVHSVKKSL